MEDYYNIESEYGKNTREEHSFYSPFESLTDKNMAWFKSQTDMTIKCILQLLSRNHWIGIGGG